jgi:hypothetical protein
MMGEKDGDLGVKIFTLAAALALGVLLIGIGPFLVLLLLLTLLEWW